jgi:hypothetical protein
LEQKGALISIKQSPLQHVINKTYIKLNQDWI